MLCHRLPVHVDPFKYANIYRFLWMLCYYFDYNNAWTAIKCYNFSEVAEYLSDLPAFLVFVIYPVCLCSSGWEDQRKAFNCDLLALLDFLMFEWVI